MPQKQTYDELEQRYMALKEEAGKLKAVEEDLKIYQLMVESAQDAIFYKDAESRYISANEKTLESFGLSRDVVIGKNDYELMPDQKEAEKNISDDQIVIKSGKPAEVIKHMTGADGRETWFQAIKVPQINSDGEVVGLVGIARDITSIKKTEESLQKSEERYRNILESIEDGYFEVDIAGNFTFFNDPICKILGYPRDELMGMNNRMYMDQENAKKIYKAFNEVYKTGISTKAFELELIKKDGTECVAEMVVSIIKDSDGIPIGFRGVARDVTGRKWAEREKKKLEAQLFQAQKMESIGTLAGGIAHDFNNLLMAIQGRTSLLLMDTDSSHPHYEHLKGIEDYIKSAAGLTKQLLGFARGGKYEIKPVDLNEITAKQNYMFGRTKKEIIIQEKFEKNLWTVEVDPGQMEQMLLNLYVNAWQAMPGGGTIYVQTENIVIDDSYIKPYHLKPGRYIKISITDTGVGMDEATRQRIFDPFFTTKKIARSTGLGLASVYGIVKNHGGFINVYSEKGEGTTFTLYLPASEKAIVKEKKQRQDIRVGMESILLVDDENIVLDVGKKIIEKLGYKVLMAKSGKEAIEIYKKNSNRIDLIVLDMIMPEMGGKETYDTMKKMNPDIKALLSSGYSLNGTATEILENGCNGFIQKPFNIGELSNKIRDILDN